MAELSYLDNMVVSPSQTSLWLQCHTLWHLEKQYGLRGESVRDGRFVASCINTMRKGKFLDYDTQDARKHVLVQLASIATMETSKTFGAPLFTELPLGKARLDEVFVLNNPKGSFPLIIDYKYHPSIGDVAQGALLARGYAYSHQLMHYAWAYMQYVGSWYASQDDNPWIYIGVCLMTDQPKLNTFIFVWVVDKLRINLWLQEAIKIWHGIKYMATYQEQGGALLKNTNACHSSLYGECSMYKRCWSTHIVDIGVQNG